MNFDEAMTAAVCGARVRARDMQPGSYVDYQFNGWRRNFAGGASSGFTPVALDREAEWYEQPIGSPAKDGWGKEAGACLTCGCTIVADAMLGTRCGCSPPIVERSWDEVMSDKDRVEGGWRDKQASAWTQSHTCTCGESKERCPVHEPPRNKWGQPQ